MFPNHYNRPIYKHVELPVYATDEFDFFRCISFKESFYGLTISQLHQGNLRTGNRNNRYSELFPGKKVSYWADSPGTARAEIKYHDKTNDLITFFSYDDGSSSFPTRENRDLLRIIDGRDTSFNIILEKFENEIPFDPNEIELLEAIIAEDPDCLAYESLRKTGGVNYLFFEKGFEKLSLKGVKLRLGDKPGRNTSHISCAFGSDYIPIPEAYGVSFMPIAKTSLNEDYFSSEEYCRRKTTSERYMEDFTASFRNGLTE